MEQEQKDYILLLDASTEVCSVALGTLPGGEVVAREFLSAPQQQSEQLAPMVERIVAQAEGFSAIKALALTEGPGSYTGLRIGAAYAKGLCFSLGIPMVSCSTTEVMARTLLIRQQVPASTLLLPMIDARRMEVYTACYTAQATPITPIRPLILTEEEGPEWLRQQVGKRKVLFFGSGAEKAVPLFAQLLPNATFVPDIYPHAEALLQPALQLLNEGKHNSLAYWEPLYLKEYEAKKSQNKVLAHLKK